MHFTSACKTGEVKFRIYILEREPKYIPPYFTGIKSVGEKEGKISILSNNKNLFDGILEIGSLTDGGDNHDDSTRVRTKNYIKIGGMKNIYISSSVDGMLELRYYDSNKKYLKSIVINIANGLASEVTIANNVEYMRFSHVDNTDLNTKYLITSKNIGISDYEPYQIDKKEILLNIEGGLKGIDGGAKDTIEMSVGLPINLNVKGVKSMARSPFEMMKILILNNNYDREDIEYKASKYLKYGRMTQGEYNEIISLMDANEVIQ